MWHETLSQSVPYLLDQNVRCLREGQYLFLLFIPKALCPYKMLKFVAQFQHSWEKTKWCEARPKQEGVPPGLSSLLLCFSSF